MPELLGKSVPKIICNITPREPGVGEPSRERGEKTGSPGFSPGGGKVDRWSASSGSRRRMNSTAWINEGTAYGAASYTSEVAARGNRDTVTTGVSQSLAQLQARIPLFCKPNSRKPFETALKVLGSVGNIRQHRETYYPESYLRHSGGATLSDQSRY
ncbi:hypothetical protein AZE42_09196 [Rhizopogon vesiculosus]|uniref:Uncharacterized protein n=1 Tax=Rhizopogon vesiculosus TaxID=180088 RepID=A0A1J8PHS0_9AGAM|nr:hypothetical protein AZE42_09196 [Rhizopogon vesiculosus]